METQEQGPRAALGYLKLALRALARGYRLPEMSGASRVYLVTICGLYAYFAVTFFTYVPGVGSGHLGVELVDAPTLHFFWGLMMATVSLGQIAVLLINHPALWRLCAVWTVMAATAIQVLFVVISVTLHSYGALPYWFAFLIIHILFVGNNLVPIQPHLELSEEEKQTFEDIRAIVRPIPSPAAQPPAGERLGHRSRRSTAHPT